MARLKPAFRQGGVLGVAQPSPWVLLTNGPAVEPIASADYPTPAQRPANSQLDCGKLERTFGLRLPAWQDGVAACVTRIVRG